MRTLLLLSLLFPVLFYSCAPSSNNEANESASINIVTEGLKNATNKYDDLGSFHEGLAYAERNGRYGFIDKLGKEIITCKYDDVEDFEYGVSIVTINGRVGGINKKGKQVIPFKYDSIGSFDSKGRATARLNEKCGIINLKGEIVIPFEYDYCYSFEEGLAIVRKDGFGAIDEKGRLVIPCKYDNIYEGHGYSEGLVAFEKDGKWGYVDRIGTIVLPFSDLLTGAPFNKGVTTCFTSRDSRGYVQGMGIINKKGELLVDGFFSINGFHNGYSVFIDERTYGKGIIDRYGNQVVAPLFDIIDLNVIDNHYFIVSRIINHESKGGLLNINTNTLSIPLIYDSFFRFNYSDGLFAAEKSGKWGYINLKNETIIPFLYDEAERFSEGMAVVQRYGKYGYVDKEGNDTFD